MAEIEIGILSRQCLSHRVQNRESLEREFDAWQRIEANSSELSSGRPRGKMQTASSVTTMFLILRIDVLVIGGLSLSRGFFDCPRRKVNAGSFLIEKIFQAKSGLNAFRIGTEKPQIMKVWNDDQDYLCCIRTL